MKILAVLGTRPEAIKMAPVIREARARGLEILVCVTAQHREMLDQVLRLFAIEADFDLDLMEEGQTLASLTARVLTGLDPVLAEVQPDWVLVQGDTTTAMVAALAAFYRRIPVGHIEAGLRTGTLDQPFPEELNRRMADTLSAVHFLPTESARINLEREGFVPSSLAITGNTVVDALAWVRSLPGDALAASGLPLDGADERLIVVTAHRRESLGAGMREIAAAIREIAATHADVRFVYPVHRNPQVRRVMEEVLGGIPRVHLLPPLDYLAFVQLMSRAYLILTDSGGVQEEAPALGIPALVLRETTERPEAVAAGAVRLVGVRADAIVRATNELLGDVDTWRRMAAAINPYGDGHASERIVRILLGEPWEPFAP
ncbi:MAG: UDP-N-acetylglucosamine 2-epimerase (non-hydrolyzing) [Deltaproteobacteria bacterium]